ncbi:DUF4190 domain-containing protein [Microbacterium sp. 179-I 3D2 NHS]|uniref:DUF4190 domain-containing protein n=1 Tax=Microbacterium sp. 179-I 3D2 NHS TaxID=3235178 RepID=UPI00399F1192
MSDNSYNPPPAAQQPPLTPPPAPPAPAAAPAPFAAPAPAAPAPFAPPAPAAAPAPLPPTQAYPGAAPSYAPPPAAPYGTAAPQPYVTPGYPAPPPRPVSGLAITSLVCGIAGLVLFWALIPMLASIAAVITGHMALRQTKRDPAIGGRGMAFAGLILGYVVAGLLVFTIVSTIVGLLFFGAFTLPFLYAG